MARKFKFKAQKISLNDVLTEMAALGFNEAERNEIFSKAENDGEYTDDEVGEARDVLAEMRERIRQRQEDEQFDAWLNKKYPTALAA